MNGWEFVLALAMVMVLFGVRRGFQPDPTRWNGKRALFFFAMTLAAVAFGCLLALLIQNLTS